VLLKYIPAEQDSAGVFAISERIVIGKEGVHLLFACKDFGLKCTLYDGTRLELVV